MLTKGLITLFIIILLFPSLVLAGISCQSCKIGTCTCTISDCDSGIIDIFSASSCSTEPDFEYTFSNGYLDWSPKTARSYYAIALCSDGETKSSCDLITVSSVEVVTTTTKPKVTTTTTKPSPSGGLDLFSIALIVLLVIAIIVAAYYLFFGKKAKKTYEELYRKWRK